MISAGKLRHLVEIQHLGTPVAISADADGQPVLGWTKLDDEWAAVEPLSARQWYELKQVGAENTVQITMRWRSDVHEGMRIVWDGRTFDITGVMNVESRDHAMVLMTTERR